MNNFDEASYSEYQSYNIKLSHIDRGPEQRRTLTADSNDNSRHSSTAGKGDSALTAFLRAKTQSDLSGTNHTQHTNSTFDTFAQEQEWEDDDDMPDDESIVSFDITDIQNDLSRPQSSYKVPDDESIDPFDIIDESIVALDVVNDSNNDLIPLSNYNEDAVDEALKWTESALMDHDDDDSDEESIESIDQDPRSHDSMSSFNAAFGKLSNCMERSALTRQQLSRQYSEKSLVSTTSSTADISHNSFIHKDSRHLQDPLGLVRSSHHSSTSNNGLVKPPIKKAQNIARSGHARRRSSISGQDFSRSISGQDFSRAGLVNKDSLASLNGSQRRISVDLNASYGNLSRSNSFRKPKLSQEGPRSRRRSLV
jgi:hypothetical protein